MKNYRRNAVVGFVSPGTKLLVSGLAFTLLTVLFTCVAQIDGTHVYLLSQQITALAYWSGICGTITFFLSIFLLVVSCFAYLSESNANKIKRKVQKALFLQSNGNPLHLQEGERIPNVTCSQYEKGFYELVISAGTCTTETIEKASSSISSALNGRYKRYAVTRHEVDLAFNDVEFYIEDVLADHTIIARSVDDLLCGKRELLCIDQVNYINLSTSESILIAGRTRSGKTTAIISLLLQVLAQGPDDYGSNVCIIDPKKAELSMLPHTYTLDEDGGARMILEVMKQTVRNIRMRQDILNKISREKGDVAHWFDLEVCMHVNLIFIDEYIGVRAAFPKKAAKDDDYCIDTFDNLIKIIITQGASTGTYCILSTAETSTVEGGLPTMLKSAMSTRILMRPTIVESRFLFDSSKLEDVNLAKLDSQGCAILTSTDGVHDTAVCRVKFPRMKFAVYAELARLLNEYYA